MKKFFHLFIIFTLVAVLVVTMFPVAGKTIASSGKGDGLAGLNISINLQADNSLPAQALDLKICTWLGNCITPSVGWNS